MHLWSLTSRSPPLRIRRLIWRGSVPRQWRPASHAAGRECGIHEEPRSGQGACAAAQPCTWPAPLLLGCWLQGPHSSAFCSSLSSAGTCLLSQLPTSCFLALGAIVFGTVFCADGSLMTDLWDSFLQAACQTWPTGLDLPASLALSNQRCTTAQ